MMVTWSPAQLIRRPSSKEKDPVDDTRVDLTKALKLVKYYREMFKELKGENNVINATS
jgi:hypothetical protein